MLEHDTKNKVLEIFDKYLERRIRAIENDFRCGHFKECDKNLIVDELKSIQRKTSEICYFINDIAKPKYWSDDEAIEIAKLIARL